MPDLKALSRELADAAEKSTVHVRGYAFRPDGTITPPAVVIDLPDYEGLVFQRSKWQIQFDAHLLVSGLWDRSTHEKVLELVPPLVTAFESDGTLGGNADTLQVVSFTAVRSVEEGGIGFVGGVFRIEVIA